MWRRFAARRPFVATEHSGATDADHGLHPRLRLHSTGGVDAGLENCLLLAFRRANALEDNQMRKSFAAFGCAALLGLGLAVIGSPANAESVMKMCGEQWKAAKAAGTTNGETWPQFLAQCRAQQKTGAATPAPTAAPAPAPPAPTVGQTPAVGGKTTESMRRGIRGEQGRHQSFGSDQTRLCRSLSRWQRDDPPRNRRRPADVSPCAYCGAFSCAEPCARARSCSLYVQFITDADGRRRICI